MVVNTKYYFRIFDDINKERLSLVRYIFTLFTPYPRLRFACTGFTSHFTLMQDQHFKQFLLFQIQFYEKMY